MYTHNLIPIWTVSCVNWILLRTVVRRQEMLQKYVEKCEEILATKADAKEALAKDVSS